MYCCPADSVETVAANFEATCSTTTGFCGPIATYEGVSVRPDLGTVSLGVEEGICCPATALAR